MKRISDFIAEELAAAFEAAGYDRNYAKVTLSNRPDLCEYLVCKVIDKMETNTHTVFLGEIIDCDMLNQETPMTYAYYHNIIKGKSPKNAPTYQPEDLDTVDSASSDSSITSSNSSGNGKWVCSICGYVYDGDIPFEELPDTFVCPICKQGKDKFKQR